MLLRLYLLAQFSVLARGGCCFDLGKMTSVDTMTDGITRCATSFCLIINTDSYTIFST